MNLLKIVFLVIIAASIALLLSNQAAALDHPWDDRPIDTTTTSSQNIDGHSDTDGSVTTPDVVNQAVYVRVNFWMHWFFGGLDSYLIGQQVQQAEKKPDRGSKPLSGRVMKPNYR